MVLHLIFFILISSAWNPSVAQDTGFPKAELYGLELDVRIQKRPANINDLLNPEDVLETGNASRADLEFDDIDLTRIDEQSTFTFRPDKLSSDKTVLGLLNGKTLVMSPKGVALETPGLAVTTSKPSNTSAAPPKKSAFSQLAAAPSLDLSTLGLLQIAQAAAPTPELLAPPQRSTAVMVTYDDAKKITQVFALTDSGIMYTDSTRQSGSLLGGQMVTAVAGQAGQPQEFDLEAFYQAQPLAAGLGPGQEDMILEEPVGVQATLTVVRVATLDAIENQKKRSFVRQALSGLDSGFSDIDEFRADSPPTGLINPQVTTGTFERTTETTGTFTPAGGGPVVPIRVDFDAGTVAIRGQTGIPQVGISGNNVSGTVILPGGEAIRFDVLNVGGKEPPIGATFSGTLTDGIAPDR